METMLSKGHCVFKRHPGLDPGSAFSSVPFLSSALFAPRRQFRPQTPPRYREHWEHSRLLFPILGRNCFTALQASKRSGHLDCEHRGDRVILGARAVTVIAGHFQL